MVLKGFKLPGEQLIYRTYNVSYNNVFYYEVHIKD